MAEELFPFALDGVVVVSETQIEHEGRVWTAAQGRLLGQFTLRPGWLRQGGTVEAAPEGEVWTSDGDTLEPSVGPAWAGFPYIPTPSYVREQVIRRRARAAAPRAALGGDPSEHPAEETGVQETVGTDPAVMLSGAKHLPALVRTRVWEIPRSTRDDNRRCSG